MTHIRNFISENYLFGQADEIQDDDSFLETGILDSTGVLQLVDFLEQTYGITVENDEVTPENLDSIAKIAAYLQRKMDRQRNSRLGALEATGSRA